MIRSARIPGLAARVLPSLGAAVLFAASHHAGAAHAATPRALAVRVHADLTQLRKAVFDIARVEELSGVKLLFDRHGAITHEQIYRASGTPRWPYTRIGYELRSQGAWAGLTLSVDRKYCISPSDLNDFYPMGEGVPLSSDHGLDNDYEIGFGDDAGRVWIVYQKNGSARCARQFRIEASR